MTNKFFNIGISLKELLLLVVSGGLIVYSMPVYSFSYCIFFAFVPFLIVLNGKSPIVSFRIGLITGFVTYSILLSWFYLVFGYPAIFLFIILSLFTGIFSLIFSIICKKAGYCFALILAPFLWISIEFLKSEQWALRFGWMSVGYSVHNIEMFLNLAKFIGIYGISFLIILINSMIVIVLTAENSKRKVTAAGIIILVFIAAFFWGKIKNPETSSESVFCRLIQADDNFKRCLELSVSKPLPENSIVVFPEYSVWDSPKQNPELKKEISDYCKKIKSYYIIGCLYFEKTKKNFFNNIALVFSPDCQITGTYKKHHPIPFFIDGEAGTDYPVFKLGNVNAGIGLCFDYDFEDVARITTRKGAEILINPTYDAKKWWYIQHVQHLYMLPFRAVETGRYALRAAASGITLIISPNGKIIRKSDYTGEYVIDYKTPLLKNKTFYVKYGYLFPVIIQVLTGLILFSVIFFTTNSSK